MASYKLLSICLKPEVAVLTDNLSKAVYILRNYLESEGLTREDLYEFFGINRGSLQRRLWSELLGFTSDNVGKTRFLSEKYEKLLLETITEKTAEHSSPSGGQVKTWV